MRNPTTTAYLPTLLACVPDLRTALARIDAYEAACARREWTGADVTAEQARAYRTVCARVAAAHNRLDLGPSDREKLVRELRQARDERTALLETVTRLREENARLTRANVDLKLQENV